MPKRATIRRLAAACAFAALLAEPRAALAAGWRIAPGLLADAHVERLAERYSDIRRADDLENLLRDIARRAPVRRLEARFEGGVWQIAGERAPLIEGIEINLVSRFLRSPLTAALQGYVGQVDSAEARDKIGAAVRAYLKRRGYPEATVKVRSVPPDSGRPTETAYAVDVNEGNPCVISRIELGFRLPPDVRLAAKAGDICDREQLQTALTELELALRAKGYNQLKIELADVVYDAARDTAVVYVSGVLGQRVRYEIVDEKKRFLIDDLFADEELTKVDPTIVGPDAMSAELARRYRNRGFSDVVIKGPDVRKAGEDEFVYVYNVDPGRQYLLKSVQFEGATQFKEEELLDLMGLSSLWQTQRPLNLEEVQEGLAALRARYQQEGYWDANVRDPGSGQKDRETGTVRLTIQIDEGLQRILKSLTIRGASAIPESELKALAGIKPGQPLDRSTLVQLQQDLRKAYMAKGYLYADSQIELKANAVKGKVEVDAVVAVEEGARVRFGEISIVGLTRTEEKVVRRELLFSSGDWYDPEKIALSRQALTRLGLFRSVQIGPADRDAVQAKERELDFVVDVREGKAGSVGFGPGWSLYRGWNYEAEAAYNNIGGVGRQASVRGQISEESQQEAIGNKTLVGRKIGTGYVEPYIFDWPVDAVVSANQKAEWGGRLWELSFGGELALRHRLRVFLPDATLAVFYGQKVAKTEGSKESEDELVATDVRIGQTGLRFGVDRRDNLKFPTAGFTLDGELAWARYGLGGDLRYFRWDVGTSQYFGLFDDLVLAFAIGLTSYEGIERKSPDLAGILPPSERLPAGGSESVRGYRPRSLGPSVRSPTFTRTSGGCAVGTDVNELDGNRRTVIKSELRYKLTESLATTGFVDSGVSFFTQDQMQKFEREYFDPVTPVLQGPTDPCAGAKDFRRIEDNIGYDYRELAKKPGYLWSRHYYSYGFSLNLLTALGAVNFGYGLPWREPKTVACQSDRNECNPRGKQGGHWLTRGEFHLNVGARF